MPRPVKRSFTINNHRTSISLEEEFWVSLKVISKRERRAVAQLVQLIDNERPEDTGLSSAVRVWILQHYMKRTV